MRRRAATFSPDSSGTASTTSSHSSKSASSVPTWSRSLSVVERLGGRPRSMLTCDGGASPGRARRPPARRRARPPTTPRPTTRNACAMPAPIRPPPSTPTRAGRPRHFFLRSRNSVMRGALLGGLEQHGLRVEIGLRDAGRDHRSSALVWIGGRGSSRRSRRRARGRRPAGRRGRRPRLTRRAATASSASRMRPASSISLASGSPTSWGSRQSAPAAAMMPSPVSGLPIFARWRADPEVGGVGQFGSRRRARSRRSPRSPASAARRCAGTAVVLMPARASARGRSRSSAMSAPDAKTPSRR